MTSKRLVAVIVFSGMIFPLATSASPAWVLWVESGDMQTLQTGAPHPQYPQSSYTSAEDCVKAIDAEWQTVWGTIEEPERHGFSRLTPTSAIMMVRDGNTNITYIATYTCLPDTVHAPEPKGK